MMKKHLKKVMMLIILLAMCISFGMQNIHADDNTFEATNEAWQEGTNMAMYKGASGVSDHTNYRYRIVNVGIAYCIECGVNVKAKTTYRVEIGDDTDRQGKILSYITSSSYDEQVKQAAVWEIMGNYPVSNSITNQELYKQVATLKSEAEQYIDSGNRGNAIDGNISTGTLSFTYDENMRAYVSNDFVVSTSAGTSVSDVTMSGAPAGSYFREGEASLGGAFQLGGSQSKALKVVVPYDNIEEDVTITVSVSGGGQGIEYLPCTRYISEDSQDLAMPNSKIVSGEGASASGSIEIVAGLKVQKKDEHGKPVKDVKLKITGPAPFGTREVTTNENGEVDLGKVRKGTYIIEEIEVGQNLYISEESKHIEIAVTGGKDNTCEIKNEYVRGATQLQKKDAYNDVNPKGDCILEGAVYTLYAAEDIYEGIEPNRTLIFEANEPILALVGDSNVPTETVTTDKEGKTPVIRRAWSTVKGEELDGLPVGNYYWKEIKPSQGFVLNTETVSVEIVYNEEDAEDGQLDTKPVDGNMDPVLKEQLEKPIMGRGRVIKMDDNSEGTEESPAEGAVLRLYLKSDRTQYYDAEINKYGQAEFIDEKFHEQYPDEECTIPYGEYILTEVKASDSGEHTYYYLKEEPIVIDEDGEIEERIVIDYPVPMYPFVMKLDSEDKSTVCIEGTEFKIWDIKNDEWVVMYDTANDMYIDTFKTNEDGNFMTPQKLNAGEYVVYETKAPYGYSLNPKWKIPENEEDLGNSEKGGKYVKIDMQALGIAEDEEYPGLEDNDLIYDIEITDDRVKGKITVQKTGPVITDVNMSSGEYGIEKTPVYANRGLEGVTYDIYAKEDIMPPDGTGEPYHKAGDKVGQIITDETGYGESEKLDLGKYYLIEVSAGDDRVIINDKPIDVELEYEGQEVPVVTKNLGLENKNKNAKLSFIKEFEESDYIIPSIEKEEKYAVFGVYAGHDIKDYKGKVVINNGDLIQTIRTDDQGTIEETLDLPEGEYYYQEIEASPSYTLDSNKYSFVIDYEKDAPLVEIKGKNVTNNMEKANLMLLKLSTSTFLDKTGLYGSNDIDQTKLDALSQQLLDKIKNLSKDELIEYLEENNSNYVLKGAEYSIYLDKDCTTPLKLKDGTEVKITTDEHGLAEVKEIPLGVYYVKETKAPVEAELADEVVTIELTTSDLESELAYRLLIDRSLGFYFEKTDIFTGDKVKDCKFIITDENQEEIASFTTNEKGIAEIPIDMFDQGETYYYQEIEAPDIYKEDGKLYKLNTEPHKFVLDYTIDYEKEEIVWNNENKEVVDNYRPVIKELIVKKTDEETGEPLQGCKFSIVLLDENGEPYVNEAGETVYLVKDAVTDENGEYRVEKPVYGTYKFIEVEAPEGYDLAEQEMEGYEFTINDETPDTLIFEVTNTGDIAVVAIVVVAVVCIAGIVFVIIRHKNQKNKSM